MQDEWYFKLLFLPYPVRRKTRRKFINVCRLLNLLRILYDFHVFDRIFNVSKKISHSESTLFYCLGI